MTGKSEYFQKNKQIHIFLLFIAISGILVFLFTLLSKEIVIKRIYFDYTASDLLNSKRNYTVKIIHQSWKDKNVPDMFNNFKNSWTQLCFKDWKYIFWTDEDNFNLIKSHYPWFLNKYMSLPRNIYRADVSRYFYLFHFGGIYTDLDNECLQPFEHLLTNYSLVFGAMIGTYRGTSLSEGYVQNSFMYSKPRHEFWLEIIYDILNFKGTEAPEVFTGPVLLSNKIKQYRQNRNVSNHLIIYPPHYFNPISWINGENLIKNCKSFDQMSSEDIALCRQSMISNGSFVIQYHAHTWG